MAASLHHLDPPSLFLGENKKREKPQGEGGGKKEGDKVSRPTNFHTHNEEKRAQGGKKRTFFYLGKGKKRSSGKKKGKRRRGHGRRSPFVPLK